MNKGDLLGTVTEEARKIVPDLDHMKLMADDHVIIAFCENCGTYHGLDYKAAEEVFIALQQPLEFEGKYLIFSSCSVCKGDEKEIILKSF
jgi:hypothetical protein